MKTEKAQAQAHRQQMQVLQMKKNKVWRSVQSAAFRFGTDPITLAAALDYLATSPRLENDLFGAIEYVAIAREELGN